MNATYEGTRHSVQFREAGGYSLMLLLTRRCRIILAIIPNLTKVEVSYYGGCDRAALF